MQSDGPTDWRSAAPPIIDQECLQAKYSMQNRPDLARRAAASAATQCSAASRWVVDCPRSVIWAEEFRSVQVGTARQ